MKKFTLTLTLVLLFLIGLLSTPFKVNAMESSKRKEPPINQSQCNLRRTQEKLWIDHVFWTKNFITSDLASLPDKDVVLERLLKNQDDIGNSIKPYYGNEAGNKLSQLLREHISLAGQVLEAAKNNNTTDFDKYNKLWYENADDIAKFLSDANPNWSNKELKNMLYKHLDLIKQQVTARLNKDWSADIKAHDEGENHMIDFSQIIANGIIKQFPDKF